MDIGPYDLTSWFFSLLHAYVRVDFSISFHLVSRDLQRALSFKADASLAPAQSASSCSLQGTSRILAFPLPSLSRHVFQVLQSRQLQLTGCVHSDAPRTPLSSQAPACASLSLPWLSPSLPSPSHARPSASFACWTRRSPRSTLCLALSPSPYRLCLAPLAASPLSRALTHPRLFNGTAHFPVLVPPLRVSSPSLSTKANTHQARIL